MRILVLLLVFLASAPALPSWQDDAALRDSLSRIEPWMRTRWLTRRGLQDYYRANSWKPRPDSGLACVGRWSYGPSAKVSLRATSDDTIICLARGSGVSIIRFRSRDSLTLQLLSDIDCSGIVSRAIIQDTFVFCGMDRGGTGIEVWGVSDLTEPHRLSYVHLPPVHDLAVKDTFLYTTAYSGDSLRAFSVADPRNPAQLGACSDSGDMMCASGDYCYLGSQYGLFIVDVSNPASPHRAGSIGADVISVSVRDTLCFFGTTEFALRVYNVRNPVTPFPVGSLSGVEVSDIYLPPTCDTVLYTPKLHVISIADPHTPRQLGFVDCPGWDFGVTAVPALNYALVADYFKGMVAVVIEQPSAPTIDTMQFAGDQTLDIYLDGGKAYLASHHAGLQVLDVGNPAAPSYLGCYDTAGTGRIVGSAAARDSFAFASWPVPRMLSIDVTDPTRPARAGVCTGMFGPPEDMVLRDSFVFCAEGRRFQVVNVARPREPVLVGSCNLPGDSRGLVVADTVAYVAQGSGGLYCITITDPKAPAVLGSWSGRSSGVSVTDTVAFVAGPYTGFVSLSVADPTHLYVLDSLHLTDTLWWNDVVVVGSLAYVGGERVWVVDVGDPRDLRLLPGASWTPPYLVRRLVYVAPYFYAACYEAGVCVLESTQVAISEELGGARPKTRSVALHPNPASGRVYVRAGYGCESAVVRDVLGRTVKRFKPGAAVFEMDLSGLQPGLYFIELRYSFGRKVEKLVKR